MSIKSVGIIGFGFAGQLHAEAATTLGINPKNILVHDANIGKVVLAKQSGHAAYRTLAGLLADEPDVCIVAVPPLFNHEIADAIAASLLKKPHGVLIDKPLALSVRDAMGIRGIMQNENIFSMIGLTGHGFHPEFKYARQIIRDGVLGKIHTYNEQIREGGPDFPMHYVSKEYGGTIYQVGMHTLDHIHYLLDVQHELIVKDATGGNDNLWEDATDWCNVALFLWERNLSIHTNWEFTGAYTEDVSDVSNYCILIAGTLGQMKIYGFDRVEVTTASGITVKSFHEPSVDGRNRHLPGFIKEVETFFEGVEKGGASPVSLEYAVKLQRLLAEIEQEVLR